MDNKFATCSKCNVNRIKNEQYHPVTNKKRCVDGWGRAWNHNVCPSCIKEASAEYRKAKGIKPLELVVCDLCHIMFLQQTISQCICIDCKPLFLKEYNKKRYKSKGLRHPRKTYNKRCRVCDTSFTSKIRKRMSCSKACSNKLRVLLRSSQ